ncbi:MAG TPA: hypothetical protein VE862_10635 [Candidatus Acidoferrum sp.]|nr:hypothetical protein [Candidatus Acidoferrum sp.]
MKQVQSYANAESDLETDTEAPRSFTDQEQAIARHRVKSLPTARHYAKSQDVGSNAESCAHDYQDNWHCRKCGYVLTKQLRARIDHVTRIATG